MGAKGSMCGCKLHDALRGPDRHCLVSETNNLARHSSLRYKPLASVT